VMLARDQRSTLFPYTTLFRSHPGLRPSRPAPPVALKSGSPDRRGYRRPDSRKDPCRDPGTEVSEVRADVYHLGLSCASTPLRSVLSLFPVPRRPAPFFPDLPWLVRS